MKAETKAADLRSMIGKLSTAMAKLDTGDLADLRRADCEGSGPAAFWRLAAACGFLDDNRSEAWMRIVKIMAILTPKGARVKPIHDPKKKIGSVLCDGGNPGWRPSEPPLLSETRLMRFLAEPPGRRAVSLERIARMIVAKRTGEPNIDCTEIAGLLLFQDRSFAIKNIARDYYRRLDGAVAQTAEAPDVTEEDDN